MEMNMSKKCFRDLNIPIRVLVFPGGTEIGLEIFRSLAYSRHIKLYGATSLDCDAGYIMFQNYTTNVPFVHHPDFINAFNSLLKKNDIEFIFPAHDTVGLYLSENRDKLPSKVLISPYDTCVICRDKLKTYQYFKDYIPTPHVYENPHDVSHFPVFLKPRVGEGSRGVYKVNTMKELEGLLETRNDLLILEYLSGIEYTVDCFTNSEGTLIFVGARERKRVANGISVDTQIIDKTEFIPFAECIHSHLKFRGAWFFQMKRNNDGQLVLLEIAPRVSGGMGLFRNRGVNLPLLTVYDALGLPLNISEQSFPNRMLRCLSNHFVNSLHENNIQSDYKIKYEHVYIDFDDTLLIKGKLNSFIFMFLIQCKGNHIPVTLLTRHKENILPLLKQYGIENIFTRIIILSEKDKKSDYITEDNSIFIDDSYSERQEVSKVKTIPVFGVDMIETLIDWSM